MRTAESRKAPSDTVNLWQRLELKIGVGDNATTFITRVEDFDKSGRITVERPIKVSGEAHLAAGQRVEVLSNRRDAVYLFDAVVAMIDSQQEGLVTLQATSEAKRTQRRKFVRIDIAGDVTYKIMNFRHKADMSYSGDRKGEILNVSAGGVLLSTREALKASDILLLNLSVNTSQRLENTLGLVKRTERVADSNDDCEYLVGIEFLSKGKAAATLPRNALEMLPPNTSYFSEALQQVIVRRVLRRQNQRSNY